MRYTLLLAALLVALSSVAQNQLVSFDLINNQLNNGARLPAEESFTIKGLVPKSVKAVTLDIYRGKVSGSPYYSYQWKSSFEFTVDEYQIFITEPLRSNKSYSFVFSYYVQASEQQGHQLKKAVHENLAAYVRANYQIDRNGITSLTPRKTIKRNLDEIVTSGSLHFKHFVGGGFPGFSDIVGQKIEQIEKLNLKDARFAVINSKANRDSAKIVFAQQQLDDLIEMLQAEVDQYLGSNMLVLAEERVVADFRTEKLPTYLPINVGYGGAYFSGNFSDFDYGTAPHAGISIPLGNRTFTQLGNMSVSVGIMLLNMKNSDGETISGPLIQRPIYAALGYRFLNVFRVHAGATLTAQDTPSGNEKIVVYPHVGLSFEFDINIRLNR